jgi:hypothetical protein
MYVIFRPAGRKITYTKKSTIVSKLTIIFELLLNAWESARVEQYDHA